MATAPCWRPQRDAGGTAAGIVPVSPRGQLFPRQPPLELVDAALLLLHHRDQIGHHVLRLDRVRLALIETGEGGIDRRDIFGDEPELGAIRGGPGRSRLWTPRHPAGAR